MCAQRSRSPTRRVHKHALRESLQVNDDYRLIMANKENEKNKLFALRTELVEQYAQRDGVDIFDKESDISSIEAVCGWKIIFWRRLLLSKKYVFYYII